MNSEITKVLNFIVKIFNILTLVGSLLILIAVSYNIVYGNEFYLTRIFLNLQLVVCSFFICDFILRLIVSQKKLHFLAYNWVLLLVSIPILNIIWWLDLEVANHWYLLFCLAPLVRGIYGLVVVVSWITRNGIVSLLVSYLVTVFCITYCGSLVFFAVEFGVNPGVHNFSDALWWAWMNVTTVGANIFAVTGMGKILTIIIASAGMMMFPIFTAFIINKFKQSYSTDRKDS